MSPTAPEARAPRASLLLAAVFIVATCGLVYELITATMASYLLGDSVTQFSLVIGVYLSAMGLGSWLSKYVETRIHDRFVQIQLLVAVVGGFSATALFFGFAQLSTIRPLLFGILIAVGTMVGLEIPLLMRIMQASESTTLKDLVARVLAFDYLGALAASLLFPLALLPHLGIIRTSLLFGVLNALVALWAIAAFRPHLRRPRWLRLQSFGICGALVTAFALGDELETIGEHQLYDAPVIFSKKTSYQRISITRWQRYIRLFIDGNLQFSTLDEHRYHEALVHPLMATLENPRRVLVLGGGDGMAVRELLKYDAVESIDLVDLDPVMTELFRDHPVLRKLNAASLLDPRVHVHNTDAMQWLIERRRTRAEKFDAVVVDLPDPNNFSLGKLYTHSFYRLISSVLSPEGGAVIQSTSPYLAPRAFWCIVETLDTAGLHPLPYHANVPSFGDWGFVLARSRQHEAPTRLAGGLALRFLNDQVLPALFSFPQDQRPPAGIEANRLNDQLLVHYYEQDLGSPPPGGN